MILSFKSRKLQGRARYPNAPLTARPRLSPGRIGPYALYCELRSVNAMNDTHGVQHRGLFRRKPRFPHDLSGVLAQLWGLPAEAVLLGVEDHGAFCPPSS